jgi:hypothetical protein
MCPRDAPIHHHRCTEQSVEQRWRAKQRQHDSRYVAVRKHVTGVRVAEDHATEVALLLDHNHVHRERGSHCLVHRVHEAGIGPVVVCACAHTHMDVRVCGGVFGGQLRASSS